MTGRHPRPEVRDSGAALILAIAFVLMVGAISAGLASLATSSLKNRTTLELVRNRQYAADGKIEEAISWFRKNRNTSVCTSSGTTRPPGTILNDVAIKVEWDFACEDVEASDGTKFVQRNVIFSAFCVNQSSAACNFADLAPGVDVVITRAQVSFEMESGAVTKTYVQSWSVIR